MISLPTTSRTTLVLMALDANVPVLVLAGYGVALNRNPVSLLLEHPTLLLLVLAFPFAFALAQLYNLRFRWPSWMSLARVLGATSAVIALFGAGYAATGAIPGSGGLFAVVAAGMVTEAVVARSVVALRRRREREARPALIVGAGWAGRTVIDTIVHEPWLRIRVAGVIDDDPLARNHQHRGVPVLGTGRVLREEAERCGARLVVVATTEGQSAELIRGLLQLKMSGVEVVDMPSFCERATGQIPIRHVEDSWFLFANGFEVLHRPVQQQLKRASDVVVSFAGLLFSLPLMAIVAALIKLDSRGPVFFRQERTGQGEKPFRLVKFRTMRADAESESGPVWASLRDYRVTRVGRWLRLTRIDEIPQFINVLRGEMSFVGPRPERPFFVERLSREIPYYSLRFAVKPGLTGWAQVQYHYGASVEDAVEKLKYDLYYIKNMSASLDLLITLKTLKVVLFAQGT